MPKGIKRKISQASGSKYAVAAIAGAICLPGDCAPVRMRDTFTSEKSAVCQPFAKPVIDWPDTPSPAGETLTLPSTQFSAMVFRHPLRSYILNNKNHLNATAIYQWNDPVEGANFHCPASDGVDCTPNYATFVSGTAFHDTTLYAGMDRDAKTYIWVDSSSTGIVKLYNQSGRTIAIGEAFVFEMYGFNSGQPYLVESTEITRTSTCVQGAALYTFNVPISDYYRIRVVNATPVGNAAYNAGGISFSVQSTCTGEIFEHHATPGIAGNKTRISAYRNIGCALWMQNLSAAQYISGNWIACQFGKANYWDAVLSEGPDPFTYISTKRGEKDYLLPKGYYGFLKPTEEKDLEYQVPFEISKADNAEDVEPRTYPLDDEEFLIWIGKTAVGSTLNKDLQPTFYFSGEFTSEDMWTDTEPANTSPDDWSNALMIVSSMQQHYENPIHWKTIVRTIGRFAAIGAPLLNLIPYTRPFAGLVAGIGGVLASIE